MFHVFNVDGYYPSTFQLNGGPESNDLAFAKLGNLTFNMGAGSDFVWLYDLDARNVTINDGFSVDEANVYKIDTAFANSRIGNVRANFNAGKVDFSLNANNYSGAESTLDVGSVVVKSTNTESAPIGLFSYPGGHLKIRGAVSVESVGTGSDTVNLITVAGQFQLPASIELQGGLNVKTGGGQDGFRIQGDVRLQGNVNVDTGSDGSNVEIGGSPIFGGKVTVSGGDSIDRISFSEGSPIFQESVSIETGGGEDLVTLQKFALSQGTTHFMKSVSISTGDQNDLVLMSQAQFGSSLTIDLGRGQLGGMFDGDHINIIDTTIDGNTKVTSKYKAIIVFQAMNAETRLRGKLSVTLGSGYVGFQNVTMEKSQVFIGNPGLIQVSYGDVTADLTKRKLINAVLV